jgi:hypothetical protein
MQQQAFIRLSENDTTIFSGRRVFREKFMTETDSLMRFCLIQLEVLYGKIGFETSYKRFSLGSELCFLYIPFGGRRY